MLRSGEPISLVFKMNESGTTVDNDGVDLAGHATGTTTDEAGDIGKFVIPYKCEVHIAQLVVTEGMGGTPRLKFDHRPTAGSNTARGEGDIGDINLGVTGVSAEGDVAYDEVAKGTILDPGDEVVVRVVTGATGQGTVWPQLLVKYMPETPANISSMQATA